MQLWYASQDMHELRQFCQNRYLWEEEIVHGMHMLKLMSVLRHEMAHVYPSPKNSRLGMRIHVCDLQLCYPGVP